MIDDFFVCFSFRRRKRKTALSSMVIFSHHSLRIYQNVFPILVKLRIFKWFYRRNGRMKISNPLFFIRLVLATKYVVIDFNQRWKWNWTDDATSTCNVIVVQVNSSLHRNWFLAWLIHFVLAYYKGLTNLTSWKYSRSFPYL